MCVCVNNYKEREIKGFMGGTGGREGRNDAIIISKNIVKCQSYLYGIYNYIKTNIAID